ncbi:E3 ubiquitin-protein ligase ATL6-like [Lotus japonicus]|uniref:E3 ubiquitin-protein ligase ATL6-like n=1 Tax=Lotus japonicus TaxID=34305 RepID=UPI0025873109|nr:E3 ubiquitin-protein ligase ATL6-like [Lotus japonicus]
MMISQTKQYTHLTLFFFLVALFHATHARPDPQPPVVAPPRASNEHANNSTLIMLFVFFVFSVFITAFYSFYVRHCSERYVFELRNKGVEPEVLATCPIVSYSAAKAGNRRPVAAECAVCLGEFEGPDALRVLPKCGHVFHPGCIDMWLASHVTCPVCRARMAGTAPARGDVTVEIGGGNGGALQVFDESSVREGEGENRGGGCGNFDGCVEEGNGSSKVGAFVRSHSTGHSLVDEAEKSVEVENQVVEDRGGSLMKRSASYDVVFGRREGWWWGRGGEVGEGSTYIRLASCKLGF